MDPMAGSMPHGAGALGATVVIRAALELSEMN
jgi:hypothetical protein